MDHVQAIRLVRDIELRLTWAGVDLDSLRDTAPSDPSAAHPDHKLPAAEEAHTHDKRRVS